MLPLLMLMVLEHLTKVTSLPRFTIQAPKINFRVFYPRTRTLSLFPTVVDQDVEHTKEVLRQRSNLVTKMLSIFLLGFQVGKGLEQKYPVNNFHRIIYCKAPLRCLLILLETLHGSLLDFRFVKEFYFLKVRCS